MKKLTYWILGGLITALAFLTGFLIRQPKVNKLKKQVERLQNDNGNLLNLYQSQQAKFRELLVQHKALKALNFRKKTASKEKLEENLIWQYAIKDYLKLLFKRGKHEQELEKAEIKFFNAFEQVIDGKKISTSDKVKIREYVLHRHSGEIKALKECDCSAVFQELACH
jgi:hypothetical protein